MWRIGLGLAVMALAAVGGAQAPIAQWSFDAGVGDWTSLDPTSSVSVTTDANVAREGGGACLEYAYTPHEGAITGALCPTPGGLAGAQGVRFYLRTSEYAWATVMLAETDGSAYIATFSSLPGTWQEVALGLNEFRLMDNTPDEDGKLDPAQISAIGFGDVVFLLAAVAKQIPFILPPDLGPRMLWVDDLRVETQPVPPRWEATQVNGVRAVRLESFEEAPLQWLSLAGKGVDIAYDQDHATDGKYGLRLEYNVPPDKAFGVLTDPADAPLAGTKELRMSVASLVPVTLLIELKEADESKYHASAPLTGTGEFEEVTIPLSDFALSDDSTDENGHLDLDQLKELLIADVSAALGTPTGANTLWLDNLLFTE